MLMRTTFRKHSSILSGWMALRPGSMSTLQIRRIRCWFRDRFIGCATLPVQEPDAALREIERVSGMTGIRGVCLPTSFAEHELSHASLFPIYQRCEALNLPVLLHPVTVIGSERLQPYYL